MEDQLYKRISFEYLGAYPGEVYLRFEHDTGPAIMVQILPGDIIEICKLADPVEEEKPHDRVTIRNNILRELAMMSPVERAKLLSFHRHPSGT